MHCPDTHQTAENEAWLRQKERSKREAECGQLRQIVAQARKAAHDEDDPRPGNDRMIEHYRYNAEYQKKCVSPQQE